MNKINNPQFRSTAMPRRQLKQSVQPPREVRVSTPEEERALEEKLAAMRATTKQPDRYSEHPGLQVLEMAGIKANLGFVRVKPSELKNPDDPFVDRPADASGWGPKQDQVILREYTKQRLTLKEIAIRHDRSQDFIRTRLQKIGAVEYF